MIFVSKTLIALIILAVVAGAALVVSSAGSGPSSPSSSETTGPAAPTSTQTIQNTNPMPRAEGDEVNVDITARGFSPQTLTVKAGTQVTWQNKSGATVSIASGPHPSHTNYPPLNLGEVESGAAVSLVFDKAGSYGYHDHLSPAQKGTIVVRP